MSAVLSDVLAGNARWTCLVGDVRKRLRDVPDGVARTAVTSPPYFGLRDYGTAVWTGGSDGCEHGVGSATKGGDRYVVAVCTKCGAARIDAQIGLEPTPREYVESMVMVMRDVRRTLTHDGTLWLNLGDSYAGSGALAANSGSEQTNTGSRAKWDSGSAVTKKRHHPPPGFKPKDLMGIPWRVAFALQDDGWFLRSDIIWAKANPMPESVTDRPTRSHEYVFLLSKSPHYFYDSDAIRERYGRNSRDVWTFALEPYAEAHFATMPPELARRCVLAGSERGDIVIDPFGGAGTTALVALQERRRAVLCELNTEYAGIQRKRLAVFDSDSDSPVRVKNPEWGDLFAGAK